MDKLDILKTMLKDELYKCDDVIYELTHNAIYDSDFERHMTPYIIMF